MCIRDRLALSLLVVSMELLLENTVDKLYLLLLIELQAVLGLLAAGLLGLALGRLGVTKYRRGKAKRLATLEHGLGILSHYLVPPLLYSTTLGRTAAVVRDRGYVLDHRNLEAGSLQCTDRSLTAGTRALNINLNRLQACLLYTS